MGLVLLSCAVTSVLLTSDFLVVLSVLCPPCCKQQVSPSLP